MSLHHRRRGWNWRGLCYGIAVLGILWPLSGCANSGWGKRVGQTLSIPTPIPSPNADPTLEERGDSRSPQDNADSTVQSSEGLAPADGETQPLEPSPGATLSSGVSVAPGATVQEPILSPEFAPNLPDNLLPALTDSIQAVLALEVLTALDTAPPEVWDSKMSRRQFARWLFEANNRFYSDRPGLQIRPGTNSPPLAFQDISPSDPDFEAIQGLAEAGILPSPLSGNATLTQFQPDAALTRERLLLWKVPLDARQALPTATIDRVEQTWNFQDSAQISGEALGAVVLDFQNGELSNIRRVFGYTTLLQPQRPVTQAEAIAALGYFGFQGQGVFAQDLRPDSTAE